MNKYELQARMKQLGISVIMLSRQFSNIEEFWVIKRQIIRAATSPGANYRAACRAKSIPDFINKLKIVEEELDETLYWLEILKELLPEIDSAIAPIYAEGNELIAIIVSSINTARRKRK